MTDEETKKPKSKKEDPPETGTPEPAKDSIDSEQATQAAESDVETSPETKPKTTAEPEVDSEALANEIADKLGEKDETPRRQIQMIIDRCGADFTRDLLDSAITVHTGTGIRTQDGKRKRSLGGVFFFLAKGKLEPDLRQEIFPNFGQSKKWKFDWKKREKAIEQIKEQSGNLRYARITLRGRPGELYKKGDTVVTTIHHKHLETPFPRGVPTPPPDETPYVVYMSARQWSRVEKTIQTDRTDSLLIEGTCSLDAKTGTIAVFATQLTTVRTERKQRKEDHEKKAETGHADKVNTSAINLENLSKEDAEKLKQLRSAAETLKERVADMKKRQSKSALSMTQKLLSNTEQQIQVLEEKARNNQASPSE